MQHRTLAAAAALSLGAILSLQSTAHGTLILNDDFNAPGAGSTTGFALNTGVNTGINPPTSTRLTGTAAANLRYINAQVPPGVTPPPPGKGDSSYRLNGDNHLRVNTGASAGRMTISDDGTIPFDFGSSLGIGSATPSTPVTYDVTIAMDNNNTLTQRMSFAWATQETSAGGWDFGIQLYRATGDTTYTVQKRIDTGSSGEAADINAVMATLPLVPAGDEVAFLLRVTDAGAETSTFNSRVQVSVDGGATFIYDTSTDAALPSGFRFDGAGRFLSFDIAPNDGTVLYDNLSINTIVPEPGTIGLAAAAGMLGLRRRRA